MKKITLVVAAVGTALGITLYAQPSSAHAQSADTPTIITRSSKAIDDIYTYLEKRTDTPAESYYTGFIQIAEASRDTMGDAQADLGHTLEFSQEREQAVSDIRSNLGAMRGQLRDWIQSAREADSDSFDSTYESFNATVETYNKNIVAYENATIFTPAEMRFNRLFFALSLVSLLLLPVWFVVHRKRYTKPNPNKVLVTTPLNFFVWNIITLGMYIFYWGWKAWQIIAKQDKTSYHTVVRAVFLPFTAFSAFRKFHDFAQQLGATERFNHQLRAGLLLACIFAFSAIGGQIESVTLWLAIFVAQAGILTLIMLPVLRAHNYVVTHTKKSLLPLGRFWPVGVVVTVVLLVAFLVFAMATALA